MIGIPNEQGIKKRPDARKRNAAKSNAMVAEEENNAESCENVEKKQEGPTNRRTTRRAIAKKAAAKESSIVGGNPSPKSISSSAAALHAEMIISSADRTERIENLDCQEKIDAELNKAETNSDHEETEELENCKPEPSNILACSEGNENAQIRAKAQHIETKRSPITSAEIDNFPEQGKIKDLQLCEKQDLSPTISNQNRSSAGLDREYIKVVSEVSSPELFTGSINLDNHGDEAENMDQSPEVSRDNKNYIARQDGGPPEVEPYEAQGEQETPYELVSHMQNEASEEQHNGEVKNSGEAPVDLNIISNGISLENQEKEGNGDSIPGEVEMEMTTCNGHTSSEGAQEEQSSNLEQQSMVDEINCKDPKGTEETEKQIPFTEQNSNLEQQSVIDESSSQFLKKPEESERHVSSEQEKLTASKGVAANLVSTIRSFLPIAKPLATESLPCKGEVSTKTAKVKALEAAEIARKKEEERAAEKRRQKNEMERARQERLKAKAAEEAAEAKRREEARLQKEAEALERRKQKEQAEKREREEKARRLEEVRQRAALAAAARDGRLPNLKSYSNRPHPAAATSADQSLEAAKQRLAKIQQQAALIQKQGSGSIVNQTVFQSSFSSSSFAQGTKAGEMQDYKSEANRLPSPPPPSAIPNPGTFSGKSSMVECTGALTKYNSKGDSGKVSQCQESYQISPYRSDFESDEEDAPKKPVPDWARGKPLVAQLMAQMYTDPDEVFQQHAKTCSLDEVFAGLERKKGNQDFSRRSSSGNWFEDRVTWKEELAYKKAMGYV